ncbi:MAG: DUF3883 domain-containing protein [Thermodesulfobacteriota bacterium]|nr:DUF3883 domain-containing protein [Thermodesulfobacteriota bacterium]
MAKHPKKKRPQKGKKDQQTILDGLSPLEPKSFEEIRNREFRPSFDLMGLKYLREKAGHERNLRELYRGRAPYELLQNADDARARHVAFVLSSYGLAFWHDGKWFTLENFRSLADGWSDKDPEQCIGHKGLGFRSVLDITPSPYLIRVGPEEFFAVKFTWALNYGHIQQTFQKDASTRQHYENWTRHGQRACPVMAIPGPAKKINLGDGSHILDQLARDSYAEHSTTMFWLPAEDSEIDRKVLEELSPSPIKADGGGRSLLAQFLEDEVCVLLPFLSSVEKVEIYEPGDYIGVCRVSREGELFREAEIGIETILNGQTQEEAFFQMRYAFDIPPHIMQQPDTPKAVKGMRQAQVVLSVRLENGKPICDDRACFHVYFPTVENTGVGFVIHGDFYVKPDRTRLMGGAYNQWLLDCAAQKAANKFLTRLLARYPASSVFEALAPTGTSSSDSAGFFVEQFSKHLVEREEGFVPSMLGLLTRQEAVLPAQIDEDGFWETQFSKVIGTVQQGKKGFLAHSEDGDKTRDFMELAQVDLLGADALLDFIEATPKEMKTAEWWYSCYCYMAEDEELSRLDPSSFEGRKLIPAADSSIIAVREESGRVVCMPRKGSVSDVGVPSCFSSVFTFLQSDLAGYLETGDDTIRRWILDRLQISNFEASELLPRAIRQTAKPLFSGDVTIDMTGLAETWSFIKRIVDLSRMSLSPEFWQGIGRFPVPVEGAPPQGTLKAEGLVPAFLAYWSDSFIVGDGPLGGVRELRRICDSFLNRLIKESKISRANWIQFFSKTGVSEGIKLLKYKRVVGKREDLALTLESPVQFKQEGFRGERQRDENRTVVQTLKGEDLWGSTVESAEVCNHDSDLSLQALTLLEGLNHCALMAEDEYQSRNDNWTARLWSLIRTLPISSMDEIEDDTAFCAGGGAGGHSVPAGSYLRRQLDHYGWLPSSHGPAKRFECFLRLSSRRLISSGRSDEELGDKLLPYVVADTLDDLVRLQHLGIEILEDSASASPSALVRALKLLGEELSTEWGQEQILEVRGRWRLVRGAIQEMYGYLNQLEGPIDCPSGMKFATRSVGGVEFCERPLYYADPGSPVEEAFRIDLPLFDSDRPYRKLFKEVGVTRLVTGKTVKEEFLSDDISVPATQLCDEIVNELAPYLLAPIVAKSEKPKQSDLILRRLRERFEVRAARRLTVSFSLIKNPEIEKTVEFPKLYLQRRLVRAQGAIEEAHYALHIVGEDSSSFSDPNLDADALGEALARVFLDGMSDELAGIFPRITARYHHFQGESEPMEEFMYYQLGISREAQEKAFAMVSGESLEPRTARIPPPPPIRLIEPERVDKQANEQEILRHQEKIQREASDLVETVITFTKKQTEETTIAPTTVFPRHKHDQVTPEQRERGRRGEEEIKRRLQLPGGWDGLTLKADTRADACGYDFLCNMAEREVKVEVKTFVYDGRVVFTSRELKQAAASQDDYYLIGVLDDGSVEHEWPAMLIHNPIDILLSKGEFDVQAKLQAPAAHVFGLSSNDEV